MLSGAAFYHSISTWSQPISTNTAIWTFTVGKRKFSCMYSVQSPYICTYMHELCMLGQLVSWYVSSSTSYVCMMCYCSFKREWGYSCQRLKSYKHRKTMLEHKLNRQAFQIFLCRPSTHVRVSDNVLYTCRAIRCSPDSLQSFKHSPRPLR